MANQFQIKRSSVSGRVPDAANVAVGELAVNLADQQLYTKDGNGNIFLLGAGNTDRLTEGTANLFYSNARARSAITAANGINYNQTTGTITLGLSVQVINTSNAITKAVANVNTLQFDSDSGFDLVDRANGIAKVQLNSTFKYWNVLGQANLVASGLDTVRFIPGNNISISLNANATPQSIQFDANLTGYAKTVDLTTANVVELTNLYYTNARVYSNVISLLPNYTGNISVGNINGTVSNTLIISGNSTYKFENTGNLLIPNAVRSNVLHANTLLINNLANISGPLVVGGELTIGSVGGDEGAQLNLGGALSNSSLSGTTVTIDIYRNQVRFFEQGGSTRGAYIDLSTCGAGVGTNLLSGGGGGSVTSVGGAVGAVSNAQLASGITVSGVLTTANVIELTNLYYTNARVYANVNQIGYAYISQVTSKANIIDLTTANVVELTNLYYTNARVYSNVISLLPSYTGNVGGNLIGTSANTTIIAGNYNFTFDNTGNLLIPVALRSNIIFANVIQGITTSNIAEGSNLYYTNARVYANISPLLTTANVAEVTNLYYTNARVYANVTSLLPNYTGNISANLIGASANTTIIAGTATYAFLNNGELQIPNLRGNILIANVIQTSNILANIADLLDVGANVPSVGQALVWTGSLWQPGNVAASSSSSSGNVILVGTQQAINYVASGSVNTFTLGFTPTNANNILVFVDGVAQNSPNNYTVSGTNLVFDENPSANSVVSVKYFDADRVYNARFFLGTTTNEDFVANGTSNTFTMVASSPDQNQTFVFVNGIIQQPNIHYTLANSVISFNGTPDSGSNIFVRTFSNSQAELLLGQLKNVSNAAPTSGQSLIWNGSNWTPGTPTSNVSIYQRYTYVAANAQTNFSGIDYNSQAMVIPNASRAEVFLNGILLERTLDYTANSTSVVLGLAAEAGDILTVTNYVDIGPGFTVDSFTGNGSNTQFTLSRTPGSGAGLLITLDGLKQHQTEFSLNGTTLSFTEAPAPNVAIEVTHMGNAPIAVANEIWVEVSGTATAIPGYKYIVNTAASAAFINLPPNPRLGDSVWFLDGTSSFDTNNLTVQRNGSRIMGQLDNFISDVEDSYFGFVYFNATYGWRLLN